MQCPTCNMGRDPDSTACGRDDCPVANIPRELMRLIGTSIEGRYRVVRHLASGGMGHVCLAQDLHLHRQCVIKLIGEANAGNLVLKQRFVQEARAIASLRSPHTVTLFDFGVTRDGLTYLSMEYVQGTPLSDLLKRWKRLEVERAAKLTRHICRSLHKAHALGIVHRDIKPANIMVTRDEVGNEIAKVLDFGIAKPIDPAHDPELTDTFQIMGTPRYLSPEQVKNRPLDGRSDLYALGCVLYEMLVGRTPFGGKNPNEIISKHLTVPARDVVEASGREDIPEEVALLVTRLLAKNPDDRPQSALEVAATLEHVAAGSDPTQELVRPGGALWRGRWLAAGGGIAGALAMGGLVFALWSGEGSSPTHASVGMGGWAHHAATRLASALADAHASTVSPPPPGGDHFVIPPRLGQDLTPAESPREAAPPEPELGNSSPAPPASIGTAPSPPQKKRVAPGSAKIKKRRPSKEKTTHQGAVKSPRSTESPRTSPPAGVEVPLLDEPFPQLSPPSSRRQKRLLKL